MFFKGHGRKILKASKRATNAMGMFRKAHDSLEKANNELAVVVNEAKRQADELLAYATQANQDIIANSKVQVKLKDFIDN